MNGLEAYPFLKELSIEQSMKMLLENDKNLDLTKYSRRVCQHTFIGSMNFDKAKDNKIFFTDN